MSYCWVLLSCHCFNAKHFHHQYWLLSLRISAACNCKHNKESAIDSCILIFLMRQFCILCGQSADAVFDVCRHVLNLVSTLWILEARRVLHLPWGCWHCNVQRLFELSSQSSLPVLKLPGRTEEKGYIKHKNRQTILRSARSNSTHFCEIIALSSDHNSFVRSQDWKPQITMYSMWKST